MNNIIYYLKFWQQCGLLNAVRFFFDKKKKNKIIRVSVNGIPHPIFLRSGTSDIYTFSDLILGNHNHLRQLQLKNPKLIIDAGANIGITSILYAKSFPEATIIALEPEASNFEMLQKNTSAYPRIRAVRKALWFQHGNVDITNPLSDHWAFQVGETSNSEGTIEALTIDHLFALAGSDTIDYLKIDVEGAEKEIFDAVEISTLKKIRMIGIELHDRVKEGCSESFYRKISQLHYREVRNFSGDHIIEIISERS